MDPHLPDYFARVSAERSTIPGETFGKRLFLETNSIYPSELQAFWGEAPEDCSSQYHVQRHRFCFYAHAPIPGHHLVVTTDLTWAFLCTESDLVGMLVSGAPKAPFASALIPRSADLPWIKDPSDPRDVTY